MLYHDLGFMYPHHIRARLALVCRAWYTVLYNEPSVWATMILRPLVRPESVSLWFKKSKSVPLVVLMPASSIKLPDNFSNTPLRNVTVTLLVLGPSPPDRGFFGAISPQRRDKCPHVADPRSRSHQRWLYQLRRYTMS